MNYTVKQISSSEELVNCPFFSIDQFLWNTSDAPKTYGQLAYQTGIGFLLRMICEESNPLRTYTQYHSEVYKDSAMEAFFCFSPTENLSSSSVSHSEHRAPYFNFEFNANAALLAEFGYQKSPRQKIPVSFLDSCHLTTEIKKESWSANLTIPLPLIQSYFPEAIFSSGTSFTCNFYKICESKEYLHFASYSPVRNETPNFHLPQYFAKATIRS